MRQTITRAAIAALTLLSLSDFAVRAAVVDDLEHTGSTNHFGGQWLYSGDWYDNGNSTILSAADTAAGDKSFVGSYGGGYPEGAGNAALLHYRTGTVKPVSGGNPYGNQVAMETRFNPDYAGSLDMTGASGITFYAKASQETVVRVSFATANITDWAYYQSTITVSTSYRKFAIPMADFEKPVWGDKTKVLNLSESQAIGWTISTDDNSSASFAAEGKLWIDSVCVEGYTFRPPPPYGACGACTGPEGDLPELSALIADFDGADPLVNEVGFYWFAYADVPSDPQVDTTVIVGGGLKTDSTGADGTGGGRVDFALGGSWLYDNQYPVNPGVNMKTELYKPDKGAVDATGATGLYFDYATTGQYGYVKVQVQTGQVFANNEAALPYAAVPNTGGQWKSAHIDWADLVLPKWGEIEALPPAARVVDASYLRSLTWTVVDEPGMNGSVAVDNIRLVGVSTLSLAPLAATRPDASPSSRTAPRVRYDRRTGELELRSTVPVMAITLTDPRGRVVARSASGGGAVRGPLSLSAAPSGGVYLVRARLRDHTSLTKRLIVR